jgi:hypothetical protein
LILFLKKIPLLLMMHLIWIMQYEFVSVINSNSLIQGRMPNPKFYEKENFGIGL